MRSGLGTPAPCPFLYLLVDPSSDALAFLGPLGRVALGYQNITIRKYEKPTRMLEAFGEAIDAEVWSRGWLAVRRPPLRGSDLDGRNV